MREPVETARYQPMLLLVLILISFVNYFDRSLVGIMAESIKRDLTLSDGQLALSTSVAFAISYSLLALPLARFADRGFRKRVIMASIAIWSTMTILMGAVHNIWQLALCRTGVALGESGVLPASHSLVSREFRPAKIALVISILWIGGFLGAASAPLVGGWVVDSIGWRAAFMLIGATSLLLVPMAHAVLREPATEAGRDPDTARPGASGSWVTAMQTLFGQRTFLLLWCGSALLLAAPNANLLYAGPFLIRTFGLSSGDAGAYLAAAYAAPMIGGTLLGGWLFDQLRRRSLALALILPGIGAIGGGLLSIYGWLGDSALTTAICLGAANMLFGLMTAPGYATAQILAPDDMKSTAAATFNLGMALFGASIGPVLAGYLSDALVASSGVRSLGYGLIATTMVTIIGAVTVIIAGIVAPRELPATDRAPA
ncbi:MFS transporter [Sphingomonas sp. YL-JM2C]